MINVKINGNTIELDTQMTIADYVDSIGIGEKAIIVEYNYSIPEKHQWASIVLKDNDNLEILKFIGGG